MIFIRIIFGLLFASLVPIGFWISGQEFVRGEPAVHCYFFTLLFFVMGVVFPIDAVLE